MWFKYGHAAMEFNSIQHCVVGHKGDSSVFRLYSLVNDEDIAVH